jgi:hypothetical protein
MTASVREQIMQEVMTRLLTVPEVSGRVYRSRAQAAGRSEMPAIIVTPIKDPADRVISICQVDRFLQIRLAIIVHDDVPDQAADPILQSAHKALLPTQPAGDIDCTLDGLAIDVSQSGDSFEFAFTEGVITADYQVQYRHREGDLALG